PRSAAPRRPPQPPRSRTRRSSTRGAARSRRVTRVLVLGGTAEARELAAALDDAGVPVISSLAGRVANPRLPRGEVRVGGFAGRQGLAAFAAVKDVWFLVRCVETPAPPLPPEHELVLDRGPYTLEGELALVDRHRIDHVITKDSGGRLTEAKLDAARARGLPV